MKKGEVTFLPHFVAEENNIGEKENNNNKELATWDNQWDMQTSMDHWVVPFPWRLLDSHLTKDPLSLKFQFSLLTQNFLYLLSQLIKKNFLFIFILL